MTHTLAAIYKSQPRATPPGHRRLLVAANANRKLPTDQAVADPCEPGPLIIPASRGRKLRPSIILIVVLALIAADVVLMTALISAITRWMTQVIAL